jgi:hypothetical protein
MEIQYRFIPRPGRAPLRLPATFVPIVEAWWIRLANSEFANSIKLMLPSRELKQDVWRWDR